MRRKGVSTRPIQNQLGHADPKTTEIYDHLVPELRRKMLDQAWGETHTNDWSVDDDPFDP